MAFADQVYQSGVRWLLNHTRPADNKKFDLLFRENVAYGFRRNALGTKPIGILISVGSVFWILLKEGAIVWPARHFVDVAAFRRLPDTAVACLIVSTLMIFVWIFFF